MCKAVKLSKIDQKISNVKGKGIVIKIEMVSYAHETSWDRVTPELNNFQYRPTAFGIYSKLVITANMPWKIWKLFLALGSLHPPLPLLECSSLPPLHG